MASPTPRSLGPDAGGRPAAARRSARSDRGRDGRAGAGPGIARGRRRRPSLRMRSRSTAAAPRPRCVLVPDGAGHVLAQVAVGPADADHRPHPPAGHGRQPGPGSSPSRGDPALDDDDLTAGPPSASPWRAPTSWASMTGAVAAHHRVRPRTVAVRQDDRVVPGGPAPAGRRLRRRPRARAASPSTPRGPSTRLPPAEALAAASVAKAYCTRAARTACETAIQVHGGIGNTWECLAHVHLRRALLSGDVLGGTGREPGAGARAPRDRETHMDFGDSPDEAAFRARLRDWLRDNNPGLPTSSTSDEYWAGPGPLAPGPVRRRVLRPVVAP